MGDLDKFACGSRPLSGTGKMLETGRSGSGMGAGADQSGAEAYRAGAGGAAAVQERQGRRKSRGCCISSSRACGAAANELKSCDSSDGT